MEILLITVCVCLLVILCVLLWKYILLKKNIRRFSQELEKLKDSGYRQPVKVTDFDKDLVRLAVKVNEHTDIQRQLGVRYEESRKQLGNVVSGISHDFRTPLTASLGYLQMLEKSGELSEKNAQYLAVAIEKNKYLSDLSDDFFEMTKLENTTGPTVNENVNISNMLTEMLLEQHSWTGERGIKTSFDIEDGIMANTDPHSLRRIFENLFSNSRKYCVSVLSVSLKKTERIILAVSNDLDDSASIDMSRVFEPFYRMRSRTAGGSGLGLYVVKLLCDRIGADARAYIDENCRFTVEVVL